MTRLTAPQPLREKRRRGRPVPLMQRLQRAIHRGGGLHLSPADVRELLRRLP